MKYFSFIRLLILVTLLLGVTGCLESSFDLAEESRLPLWFEVPEGEVRETLRVTMDYYVKSSGGEAIFRLFNQDGKVLKKVKGITMNKNSIRLKKLPSSDSEGHPSYVVINAGGVIDIIEHRKIEPIFYVTDNPEIWAELGFEKDGGL